MVKAFTRFLSCWMNFAFTCHLACCILIDLGLICGSPAFCREIPLPLPSTVCMWVNEWMGKENLCNLIWYIFFKFWKDNYLEEAMKMRNLLEEFHANHGLRPPSILGVREHVFTGRLTCTFYKFDKQSDTFKL